MKTILGLSSAALAGATTQSIAAAANNGPTVVLNLRFFMSDIEWYSPDGLGMLALTAPTLRQSRSERAPLQLEHRPASAHATYASRLEITCAGLP